MSDKKHDKNRKEQKAAERAASEETPEVMDILDDDMEQNEEELSEEAENARLQNELEEARAAVEKEKKEYLFLMADFDNYRKRVTREKADLIKNASERVLTDLLPIVDDFERGLAAAKKADDAEAIRQGMEMIYNKLVKFLEAHGVKAIESTGETFNPDLHEAIATIPAPSDDLKGKVVDTTQKGYMLNDKVLRYAKVAVGE